MQIPEMFKRDDAVSPVIGVILMVAITVILAAVIAAFVFGLDSPESAPQASIKMSAGSNTSNDYITVTHQGGDAIFNSSTDIILTTVSDDNEIDDFTENMPEEFGVGDRFRIVNGSDAFNSTINVQMIDTQSQQPLSSQNVRF